MGIRIEGLDELTARIKIAQQLKGFKAGLYNGAKHVRRVVRLYPRQQHRRQPFKTAKQRRYFFWALRQGIIQVPYVRTLTLKRNWNIESANGGLVQIVANATPYGPLVQGAGSQANYHRQTGWTTDAQVAQQEAPEVVRLAREGLEKDLG